MHELLDPATSSGGERGIRLISKSGKTQDWPLPYSSVSNVRVGIYWYPKMFGGGPYIRFYDATGESVLDLNRREVGGLTRAGGGVYEADYSYNTTTFSTNDPIVRPSTGASPRVIPKGKPVRVLTSVMPPKSGKYLGSVVRVGNKIVFSPAGN